MKVRQPFAQFLRTLANWLDPKKKPTAKSTAKLSITRMDGAMIGISQWVVQALLTGKTPHPGNRDSVTVFFPQLDLKKVTEEEIRTFDLSALVTTLKYSSFGKLTGTISFRPRRKEDTNSDKWHIIDAEFKLTGWNEKERRFKFNEVMLEFGQPDNHLISHFRCYFYRLMEDGHK